MTDANDSSGAGRLPHRVQPRRQAAARARLAGDIELGGMSRLAESLAGGEQGDPGRAHVEMDFHEDAQRRVVIEGRLQADLRLQCQTCLQPLDWHIDQALALVAVTDDAQAEQVPRSHDPLEVAAEGLELASFVEDELILALPAIARCDDPACPNRPSALDERTPTDSPFAVLRRLKDSDE